MQNIGWKIALIISVIGICLWALYPPEQKIRLGTDLRGGTSLIYTVNIPDGAGDKATILNQTISVLKDRVNPQGVLDISMQPLGLDRIEIVMPLPNQKVLALREDYRNALKALLAQAEIQPAALDEALKFNKAVEQFGGGTAEGRSQDIAKLQAAYNKQESAGEALRDAVSNNAPPEALNRAQQAVADAQWETEQFRDKVLKQSLDEQRVVRTLNLGTTREPALDEATGKPKIDPKTGDELTNPSQREVAVEGIKSDFPYLAAQLDKVIGAWDTYTSKRTGFDDPEDLMRLLRGAGVLEFHIAVRDVSREGLNVEDLRKQLANVGPENVDSPVARWYAVNDLRQWARDPQALATLEKDPVAYFGARHGLIAATFEGRPYLLLYTSRDKAMVHEADQHWSVESTYKSADELGKPGVSFRLDAAGGQLMGRLTGAHVGEPMAIVLDNQVYSAPSLRSQINNSGIITGDFSDAEINYLIRVLAAGALEARLSDRPIAINTLGPSVGADNLRHGLNACFVSIIAVASFMVIYYFWAGLIANFAVIVNGIIIFGVMAMMDGTFTLPGLAGIALTVCTAVDANILIYERIREESEAGHDVKTAVRLGYSRAFSTILDANVTNLVMCVALIYTATTEVKGFAYTMCIGILGTLFTALFMTRVIFTILIEGLGVKKVPFLATAVPAVHRLLQPNLDWMALRKVFIPFSAVLVLISLVLIGTRGSNIFDTQFRGGLAATMRTAFGPDGERTRLKQAEVEKRIHEMGERAAASPADPANPNTQKILNELRFASVLTVGGDTGIEQGMLTASGFKVNVALPPGLEKDATIAPTIVAAIVKEFGSELDVTQPLTFAGAGSTEHGARTFPVTKTVLGENIQRPTAIADVKDFIGGVAVVLDEISPPVTLDEVKHRIDRMRQQPDFSDTSGRNMKVVGLDAADPANPAKGYSSIAVVVSDTALNYNKMDFSQWDTRLAAREWKLISQALDRPASLEQVSEFSSAVAETLRANAVVAVVLSLLGILVYIWIRFGSLRYSAGAVIALIHDAAIGLGALALSQYIGNTAFGKALLIEEFHINLEVIAAVLTLMGYSLNDTIVVLDRIRENRGKLTYPTAETVNKSINQTFSRTFLTSMTVLVSLFIMYVVGGTGIRAFSYVMLVGMIVGTYSSIAIAAPMVWKGHDEPGLRPSPPTAARRLVEPVPVST